MSTTSQHNPIEQAQLAGVKSANQGMWIGVPKERGFQEKRVGLTPHAVSRLAAIGVQVKVETGAGFNASFEDHEYTEAGSELVYSVEEVYQAPIIVRVGPAPKEEWPLLKPNSVLLSAIHLPTLQKEYLDVLVHKRITAIAYEYLKDSENNLPFVRSMGEIAGISVVLIAAECLSTTVLGRGKLIGGITGLLPSKIVILGAGTVAEYATQAALGLGAQVTIFDRSLTKMRRLQNKIGNRVLTSVLDPATLTQELKQCDVVIGAIHSNDGRSPMIVTEEMVMQMKPGSVIVDVSIDQGGCFETSRVTTHDEPTFREYDVIHYCVPNIPSRYARTASIALSNLLGTLLSEAEEAGGLENYLWTDSGMRHGAYAFGGAITNRYLSQKFDEPYVNLEIMARGRFS
jgi:alanine dehydrogenase